jgi:hypothetical protein
VQLPVPATDCEGASESATPSAGFESLNWVTTLQPSAQYLLQAEVQAKALLVEQLLLYFTASDIKSL